MSTTTLTFEHKVDGVLTDLDAAPTLSESTATYGVRRTDTNATVVADDTAMTAQSTGIYTYTIDPDPASGLTYEWWVEAVYNTVVYFFNFISQGSGTSATLDAVNKMLRILGEPPATALDTGGTSLRARAETILDEHLELIQMRGWGQNTLKEQSYTPDSGDSEIDLASNVLKITPVMASSHWRGRVTKRNDKVFDLKDNDYTFDSDMVLDVVIELTLDEMTDAMRDYIVAAAAVEFQRAEKRGEKDDSFARDQLLTAKTAFEAEDMEYRRVNIFDTSDAQRVRGVRNAALARSTGVSWNP